MPRTYPSRYKKRLKPGTSPFFGLRMTRKKATAPLYRKITKARSIGLKNVRTGGLLGVETKFLDMGISATNLVRPSDCTGGEIDPVGVGSTGCLSAPAQGDTASSREGMKIVAKSIQVEGIVACAAGNTPVDNTPYVTVYLVLDTQTNGAQLNSEDVFTNPTAQSTSCCSVLRNMSYTERFKVLKSKRIRIPQLSVSWDGTDVRNQGCYIPFKMFVNLGALPIKFTAGSTTANVSGVVDNSLHLIAYCTDLSYGPTIQYNARLRFVG